MGEASHSNGPPSQRALSGRRAGFAAEELMHVSGISQGYCLMHGLAALIARRHLASCVQGGRRLGVQIVGER